MSIHRVPDQHISSEYFTIHESALMITAEDFTRMGYPDLTGAGEDGDTLVYDPHGDTFKTVSPNRNYDYICTHKHESKPGNTDRL